MTALPEPMRITSPTLHATIWFTISVFAALVIMACVFKVEVVARGQGKVVPVSRVQVVQPEFDGKITAIHVRNGDAVARGDVLIALDPTDAEAELNTLTAEMARLRIEGARISALVAGVDGGQIQSAGFAAQVAGAFAGAADTAHTFYPEQARLLAAEIDDLQAAMAQIAARVTANQQSIAVTGANIDRITAAIAIQTERLEVAQNLLERGTSSRAAFLDVQEGFTALEKERDIALRELDQKRSQETALLAERRSILTAQRNQLLQRRAEIEARLATLEEQLRTAERRKQGAQLTAPMDGVVDQLEVYTIGAVARSGEQLLRVVPKDQNVEIEAVFTNADIGFVEAGQQANINLEAYPSERFGFVKGKVSDVAADSTESAEGLWTFAVRITPDRNVLDTGEQQFALRPGMTAAVDITTDKRRLISYFFAPIVDTINQSLGER
ncbi:HlyD family type I secretion periplasmic adaptor subunit [Tropicibacter naphthalenivorans]|uniref:Membrane fusion protein (MFP) family protein n=1 Tax=Tropicibacter naphthalenivorans TaxID=441103 RepID=A0A0P1GVB8_9RHOB|nr:HlyD family type I secretion periplasmic adaptor subunit [Tropicibacter naphthalenivorans]CUH80095.1 Hemolysin secretion protein D, chromosomal [Tropicibacter naphthalenivorans]SMC84606.1 hemolysin D [Tropicibacter naphthalenivorans]